MNVPPATLPRHHRLWRGVGLLAASASALFALALVNEVIWEGEAEAFDETLLLSLRNPMDRTDPLGPAWLEEVGRDLTALGGIAVQGLVVLVVGGYLWLRGAHRALVWLLISMGGGLAASSLLKNLFARPRPHLVPHASWVYTSSFPSGHSMMSAVTYMTLGVLLARMETRYRVKAFVIATALLMSGLVGISRVYLGVHWPTDVMAGWSMGATWALLCWLIMRKLQERGTIEPPGTDLA